MQQKHVKPYPRLQLASTESLRAQPVVFLIGNQFHILYIPRKPLPKITLQATITWENESDIIEKNTAPIPTLHVCLVILKSSYNHFNCDKKNHKAFMLYMCTTAWLSLSANHIKVEFKQYKSSWEYNMILCSLGEGSSDRDSEAQTSVHRVQHSPTTHTEWSSHSCSRENTRTEDQTSSPKPEKSKVCLF